MAIIYSGVNDGYVRETDATNFANARDATSGIYTGRTTTRFSSAIATARYSARGGGYSWQIYRAFFQFDTSGITVTPSSADLKIFGYSGTIPPVDFFVVKSEQLATLSNGDFDAITGWSNSGVDNESNVTKYSNEITSWNPSGYDSIELNSAALSDMVSLSTFKICLLSSVWDLRNVDPGSTSATNNGCYFADTSGSGRDPKIDYTAGGVVVTHNAPFFGSNF